MDSRPGGDAPKRSSEHAGYGRPPPLGGWPTNRASGPPRPSRRPSFPIRISGPRRSFPSRSARRATRTHIDEKERRFPLVEVGCLPIKTGLPGGPLRHVSTFGKKDLPGTGRVFPRPNNVVVFRPRRLSGLSTSDRCVQVVDSHAFSPSSPCGGRGAGVGGVPLTALACLDPKGRDLPKCALALKPGKGLRQKSREKHLERQVLSSLATGLDHDMINAINCQKL